MHSKANQIELKNVLMQNLLENKKDLQNITDEKCFNTLITVS